MAVYDDDRRRAALAVARYEPRPARESEARTETRVLRACRRLADVRWLMVNGQASSLHVFYAEMELRCLIDELLNLRWRS